MSDNTTTVDVDKELADRVDSPETNEGSQSASEALLGLQLETQAAPSRVSLSPNNRVLKSGDEDDEEEESDDEEDSEDEEEDPQDDVSEAEEEEADSVATSKGVEETESDLPIGWMSAQLKLLEDESKSLKKELRKFKGQNTRLRQALAKRKAEYDTANKEVKSLKKENETLMQRCVEVGTFSTG